MRFPVLEVLAARTGPQPGERISLGDRLRFGRAREAEVRLETPLVSRFHCSVVHELDRWWLRDLSSANGTRVHGTPIQEEELKHGTIFEISRGHVYEFLERERDEVLDPTMEAAIRAAPDDDARWSVYADWLSERGAPLGEALSKGEVHPKWLGPFAGDLSRREVQALFKHGVPSRLTLRSLNGDVHDWTWEHRLAALRRAPGLRFVRELEFDLASCLRTDIAEEAPIKRVVDAIGDALPMLERLIISPTRIFATSRLSSRFEVQLRPWKKASVTLTELRPLCKVTIEPDGPRREPREMQVGETTPLFMRSLVEVTGSAKSALLFVENGDLREVDWRGYPAYGMAQLNGLAISRAFVRSGDVIQIVPGVTLVFSA
ncbi:MAG: FHA domain-containing protein [Archangium sp.]